MRKQYIQPEIQLHQMNLAGTICVGSVHGNAGLEYGGGSDGSNENEKPF